VPQHQFKAWIDATKAWPGQHFGVKEFAQRGSGWNEGHSPVAWDDDFIRMLDALREAVGHPLIITSGYRSPQYNASVSSTGETGPHTEGRAADIAASGPLAHKLLLWALRLGFTGIGVSQKGTNRFIHLDHAKGVPRPAVWSY
jgi:hypothetical protein